MSMNASRMLSGGLLAGLLLCGGVNGANYASTPKGATPDFSSSRRTWVLSSGTAFLKAPGDAGPGPIMDKNFPGSAFDQQRGGARSQNRIADTTNPILKPWAKQLMDIANERVAAGGIPFVDDSRCWLGGVPSLLLFPGEAVVFLQTPKEVWILSKRDAQVRRIYINVPHSKTPAYSWTGESVGHYENGDTLVVDTIGLDDQGPRDRHRTPHTKQLHHVERYELNDGGKGIEISFTIDDPGAFTMPWEGKVDFNTRIPTRPDHLSQ